MGNRLFQSIFRALVVLMLTANAYAAGDIGGGFVAGWNLSGNSTLNPVDVPTVFGTSTTPVSGITSNIVAIWTWDSANKKWRLFTPALSSAALATFAANHGHEVLTTINSGEGYWVYASAPFDLPAPQASDGTYALTGADLVKGWNLAITGQSIAPKDLYAALENAFGSLPPSPGGNAIQTSAGFISLWTWDNSAKKWYFYAPMRASANGMLARHISRTGLLDFTAASKTLGPSVGFWINMP